VFNRRLIAVLIAMTVACQTSTDVTPEVCYTPETFYCFSYGNYPQMGEPCVIDTDCTVPLGPCEVQVCDDGACRTEGKGHKQAACGGEHFDLWCNDKDCCGWMDLDPLW
jgi:hypothetical protein